MRLSVITTSVILCIRPLTEVGKPVNWSVEFKTREIAKRSVQEWTRGDEGKELELMRQFSSWTLPRAVGRAFIGWLFGPLAHRHIRLNRRWPDIWQLKPMKMEQSAFILDTESSQLMDRTFTLPRRIQRCVRFTTESITKETPTLTDVEYYVPQSYDFPLIDSFLVSYDLEAETLSADLFLFQMGISAQHAGSELQGYARIQNIISILQRHLDKLSRPQMQPEATQMYNGPVVKKQRTDPEIRVHCVLVCPEGDSENKTRPWTFPSGWNDHVKRADHRADAFLMEINVQVRPVLLLSAFSCSWLSLSLQAT
ncbi:hypothetical protein C8Q76DRAFT_486384 [Earliella scabrosa]|nr:hypothetical protein C8Q76DRAFT_486384 [Earliella scabrosa]